MQTAPEQPELIEETLDSMPVRRALPADVAEHVVRGTSILGAAVFVERGSSFLANVLAVRFAGPAVFGAYSLGITTANNISTYAAGGIGTTATRFSAKYPYDGGNYRVFAQVMSAISMLSACLAAIALSLGAGPIARVLHKPELVGLLQWAGITAAGMVLLECARGFFVGQRRLLALASLSLMVGLGMLVCIPITAHTGRPVAMVVSHGFVTLTSVLLCVVFAARLQLMPSIRTSPGRFFPLLREVWGYGFIQLSGLVSANVAGWWVTALVAQGDPTLTEVSFFAIASQLRNIIGLVPSLLTEGSFAAMAAPEGPGESVPQRVMMLCTYASTVVSFLIAASTVVVAPLFLHLLYGQTYTPAALAVSIAVGVAVIQMGNAPPSARLSVISIRSTAVINTAWAGLTAGVGTVWMFHGGTAASAMGVFLIAHILIAAMVLTLLSRRHRLPSGMLELFLVSTGCVALLCLLSIFRASHPSNMLLSTILMIAVTAIGILWLYRIGSTTDCLPSRAMLRGLTHKLSLPIQRLFRRMEVRN